jgi:N utilization substance protein A
MQALSGGPSTPIEQVIELGEAIIQKLVAAGITTVESLADMTPEQLEEIPGIGEKTLEKISVAVRHYFGQYEEGEERPEAAEGEERPAGAASESEEGDSMRANEDIRDEVSRAEQNLVDQRPAGDDVVEATVLDGEDVAGKARGDRERSPNRGDLEAIEADRSLDEERAKADAELGEEVDALEVDDSDGVDDTDQDDGTGRVVDEIARERMEELTESGREVGEVGVLPQDAGRDDTSDRLRRQNPANSPLPGGEAEEESVLPDARPQRDDEGV